MLLFRWYSLGSTVTDRQGRAGDVHDQPTTHLNIMQSTNKPRFFLNHFVSLAPQSKCFFGRVTSNGINEWFGRTATHPLRRYLRRTRRTMILKNTEEKKGKNNKYCMISYHNLVAPNQQSTSQRGTQTKTSNTCNTKPRRKKVHTDRFVFFFLVCLFFSHLTQNRHISLTATYPTHSFYRT